MHPVLIGSSTTWNLWSRHPEHRVPGQTTLTLTPPPRPTVHHGVTHTSLPAHSPDYSPSVSVIHHPAHNFCDHELLFGSIQLQPVVNAGVNTLSVKKNHPNEF